VANSTYYYHVPAYKLRAPNTLKPGVYAFEGYNSMAFHRISDMIWRQGARGGVKLIKNETGPVYGYITKNESEMKKFIWAKLTAHKISGG
jgi:hypothetical protein